MKKANRAPLYAVIAVLLVAVVVLQSRIDPLRRQPGIEPPNAGKTSAALPFEYSLAALSGFRQVVAGLLWVRADSFFHEGNYDAILPLIRMITWLDPNWLDVYSTGAWHLMYNFTDEQQRSDRRYLPAGLALLTEGVENNANVFDLYADLGWNYFDKVKDYDKAVEWYEKAMEHNPDYTRVGHLLAHSLERSGRIDDSIAKWEEVIRYHQKTLADPKSTQDQKMRAQSGIATANRNLNIMKIRRVSREEDTKPPVDAQLVVRLTRTGPKKMEVSGEWNLQGAKNFDARIWGPVDGARVDVRLQNKGYKMPEPKEFTFDVDPDLTIMQDQISTRGGKQIGAGDVFIVNKIGTASVPKPADEQGMYGFNKSDFDANPTLGLSLKTALATNFPLSVKGKRQIAAAAFPAQAAGAKNNPALLDGLFDQLRKDAATVDKLDKQGYFVAKTSYFSLGAFKREIDMSTDPRMYSFTVPEYDVIVTFNPRNAPEFVQDRLGWNGEGLTDKKSLVVLKADSSRKKDLRILRQQFLVTKDELLGSDKKPIGKPVALTQ